MIHRRLIRNEDTSSDVISCEHLYGCDNRNDHMISMTYNEENNTHKMTVQARKNGQIIEIACCKYTCPSEVCGTLTQLSHDNSFVVVALSDGTIKVFELTSEKHITFSIHI